MIPGAQRLELRRLEMVEVDVDATAVAAEILPTPVLRVVALGAAERLIAAGIRRVDLAQQGSRRLAGGAVGTIGAENEVGKFDIGAAELGKTIGVPGHRSPLQAARVAVCRARPAHHRRDAHHVGLRGEIDEVRRGRSGG